MTIVEECIQYLNTVTNQKYDPKNKETTQLIDNLMCRGYTIDDLKMVIDKKWSDWKGTQFSQYLRPSTLFGSKFEKYLHEQPRIAKTPIHQLARAVNKAKSFDWRLD